MVYPIASPTRSYWIQEADSEFRDYRSTCDLPTKVDVVIIGSGYTGATTAYWLNKYAAKCPSMLLLEARDICGGATGRNGGQLRPHLYSRWTAWAERFGVDTARDLVRHEYAHFDAFKRLFESEGIANEVCFKMGDTFDAAMTVEAWDRLKAAYEGMKTDCGDDDEIVKACRLIEDPTEAEEFTQMKGCLGAVVHPSGQVWPYKFVHALLRITLASGNLNLQAHTPVVAVSDKDSNGWIHVQTERGTVLARSVIHATNRWAGHLLEEFKNLIVAGMGTLAAIKAPEGFLKHTGAQHWDSTVYNYHLQLPPPHNHIIVGGAKQLTVHDPSVFIMSDREDKQYRGAPEYYKEWPRRDIVGWDNDAELARGVDDGGVWTGVYGTSVDSFPFVGHVPHRPSQFIAAGFTGHGMPRILLSTAYIVPRVLDDLGIPQSAPPSMRDFPDIPLPFRITTERMERLKDIDLKQYFDKQLAESGISASKSFCARWKGVVNGSADVLPAGGI